MIESTSYEISDSIKIHLIDIKEINDDFISLLDSFFVKICEGDSGTELELVKINFKNYLNPKRGTDLEKGSIAEFFIHLFLNYSGYKQECLFENLEENSIKKGFDGYYSLNNEEWLMESKSGSINSQNITHEGKIKKGYDDLKGKIGTRQSNNPWKNAYNHANNRNVNTNDSILKNIKSFSDDYIRGIIYNIKDFNIIPASTIFLNGTWEDENKEDLKDNLLLKLESFDFNKIIVICVTKKSIDLIYDYLGI